MSFDDGSLGRNEDRTDPGRRGHNRLLATLLAVYDHLGTHTREWPARHIEQQASMYEDR
jgi:hypothetical protein